MPKVLRLILGDQLNEKHSWFSKVQDDVMYCMMELKQETGYVRHHIQKIMAFFDAMRNFSCILEERGHQVKYIKISDSSSNKSFGDNLNQLITKYNIERFEYMLPDEYRLDMQLSEYCKGLNITSSAFDTEHFMCTREQLKEFFATRKTYILEAFYRDIRRRHDILMDDGEPMGGKWNYDHQNRESLKRGEQLEELELADRNLESLFKEIKDSGIEYIGRVEAEKFKWISRRDEGLEWLDYWLDKGLPKFGKYQDAMHNEYKFLFHSRLSFLLNAKLISPKEIVE
ncbi:MAG: cryptochrome/photolyase family protein, partial [Saprospiraceae bacterium]